MKIKTIYQSLWCTMKNISLLKIKMKYIGN